MADDEKKRFIFVIGAPGAGKGTLAKRLAKDNDFTHISVGDMLRGKVDDNAAVAWHVKNSELLPPEHLFPLLQEEFRDSPPTCPIILDGFPRNADQMRKFEKRFGAPHLVLFFQCPKDVVKDRVVRRGREGDTSETFDKRYEQYLKLTPPILAHYSSNDKLVEVDTSGETKDSYVKLEGALRERDEWAALKQSPHSPETSPSP